MKGPAEEVHVGLIDVHVALRLLSECVSQRGQDFVYQPKVIARHHYTTCVYSYRGEPDCLVGHFLARCGMPTADLDELGDDDIWSLYAGGRVPFRLSKGALQILQQVQESQDRQLSWGEALTKVGGCLG